MGVSDTEEHESHSENEALIDEKMQAEGDLSRSGAIANLSMMAIGIGILWLPKVFVDCGWIGGTLLLAFGAIINAYTSWKLYRTWKDCPGPRASLDEISGSYFGRAGKILVSVTLNITLLLVGALLLHLAGLNVGRILSNEYMGDLQLKGSSIPSLWRYFTLGIGAIMLPTAFITSMRKLSMLSYVGLSVFAVFVVLAVTICVQNLLKYYSSTEDNMFGVAYMSGNYTQMLEDYLAGFGKCFFASSTMTGATSVLKEMKVQSTFTRAATTASVVVFFLYLLISLIFFFSFAGRGNLNGDILSVVSRVASPGYSFAGNILMLTVALCNFTALLAPLSSNLDKLTRRFGLQVPIILLRLLMLILTTLLGIISAHITTLVNLLGGVTIVILGIFVPVGLGIQAMTLRNHPVYAIDLIFMFIICLVGGTLAVNTTVNVAMEI